MLWTGSNSKETSTLIRGPHYTVYNYIKTNTQINYKKGKNFCRSHFGILCFHF